MSSSCPPPDIEELCTDSSRVVSRKKSTMSTKLGHQDELKSSTNNNHVNNLLRSVSDANLVAFCTCQQSRDFPFCDNTHTIFNKATNANISPLYVAIVEGKCTDCGSKLKDRNGLSHSMDNADTSGSRGCTLTLSDNSTSLNILNNSTDLPSSVCKCKPNKLSVSTPDLSHTCSRSTTPPPSTVTTVSTSTQTTPKKSETTSTTSTQTTPTRTKTETSTSTPSTPTSTTTTKTTSISTPTPTRQQPPTTPQKTSEQTSDNTCNITTDKPTLTKVYIPSSTKSPVNQKNIITKAEVALHATQGDLWMIINGSVYDITDYVQYHPGGTRALVKFAGKDGSENVHYHSSKMLELLNQYYFIGKLPKHEGGPSGGCIIS